MPRQKQNRQSGVQFTRSSAKEIAETVRIVNGGNRRQRGTRQAGNAYASSHYLSKTTGSWTKGSSQTLTIYVGSPGSETASSGDTVVAWNKFATVQGGKWVMLARANGAFYLIAAEC